MGEKQRDERRVLVVEDERPVCDGLIRIVRPHGEVLVAHDVASAVEFIVSGVLIDSAIVDLGLPDGSGFEVLRHLGAAREHVPALVLTGDGSGESIATSVALGATHVVKPTGVSVIPQFLENRSVDRYLAAVAYALRDLPRREWQIAWRCALGDAGHVCAELEISKSAQRTYRAHQGEARGDAGRPPEAPERSLSVSASETVGGINGVRSHGRRRTSSPPR